MKLLIFILLFSVPVFSQTKVPAPASKASDAAVQLNAEEADLLASFLLYQLRAEVCDIAPTGEACRTLDLDLAKAMSQASKSPKILHLLAAKAANAYDKNKNNTKSAPQASQIADEQNAAMLRIIVMQNQRMIELLEQILKKK